MFTSMENRKAVESMKNLIQELHQGGASSFMFQTVNKIFIH